MKKTIVALVLIGIIIYGFGCCGVLDKAKDLAKDVESTVDAMARFSEDIEKLKNEDGEFVLTQARIDKFIKQYPIFKEIVEKKGEEVESAKDDYSKGMKSLNELANLDKDLRDAGIDNPAEFYLTFGEISAGMLYLSFEHYAKATKEGMSDQAAEFKKQLEDPNTPEDQKEMLREAIKAIEEVGQEKPDVPGELNEDEVDLIRKNFDAIAKLLGMEFPETQGDQETEEAEVAEAEEPKTEEAEKPAAPKPPQGQGGKPKGARVE